MTLFTRVVLYLVPVYKVRVCSERSRSGLAQFLKNASLPAEAGSPDGNRDDFFRNKPAYPDRQA